ncbi:galactose oxidase/kelch repeat superfamily protein [Striga asiatica]|uniref:Galactose oxidase/kelch repeat superfamily protein n=1 Tax=Striga asiatica TaxID=4170 RepID=A0A5A7Q930_STRAF|nr:galactose oxidase/kelch repeat superfamily protein [Striga asiatica]
MKVVHKGEYRQKKKKIGPSPGLDQEDMLEDRPCLVSRDYPRPHEHETNWHTTYLHEKPDIPPNKRPLDSTTTTKDDQILPIPKLPKTIHTTNTTSNTNHDSSSSLIPAIGRDNSITCLLRCSRADYGPLASLNRSFRSLIKSGELYRLRRLHGIVEHWVYFSCQLLEWEAFDPSRRRWLQVPRMNSNDCFVFADKESLAVGTELLVFGRDLTTHIIHRYSLLTNSWAHSPGPSMHEPRCLFGSASSGEIAILAGGCDSGGNILSSAELYNSETGTWTRLPGMRKARKMCSGVFMDGKFYVIGGIGWSDSGILTCGEEFDPASGTWTEIPNMSPVRGAPAAAEGGEVPPPPTAEAPPLIAVVKNELYAADHAEMEVICDSCHIFYLNLSFCGNRSLMKRNLSLRVVVSCMNWRLLQYSKVALLMPHLINL